ncbi:MAG: prenyltransferase [Myxococcota bacterium]
MSPWIQAARPLAQANLAAPLLFGQALAYACTGHFRLEVLACVALWGVFDQLFIVFANDYADRDDDVGGDSKTLFSGGSGVLPEGKITPQALRRAAVMAYAVLGILSVFLSVWRSVWILAAWVAAGVLLWAYSFPPLRRSYRGGGEWLQALGVGGVLPLLGFAAQAGGLSSFPWAVLAATLMLGFAGNVSTALPDYAADRRARKRTWAVRFGVPRAAWGALGLTVSAIYLAIAFHPFGPNGMLALAVLPLLPALRKTPRGRSSVVRFVFLQGAASQSLLLLWAFVTVRG